MTFRTAVVPLFAAAALFLGTGARVRPSQPPVAPSGPTFNKEVVRIFQQHCQSCHRPGDVAPFSLVTYEEAKPWSQLIKLMTQTKQMPPWKPSVGCGEFAQERRLTQDEIATIGKWVDNGAPEGVATDLPPPLEFESGWLLGEPDLVLKNPEPYTPPAGDDVYRCFTVPTQLTSAQYVSAIDIRPGARETVHHVIAYIDTSGESARLDANDAGPGYTCFGGPGFSITDSASATLGGWAPGTRPAMLPPEIAYSLPAQSRVVLQVHYHVHDDHEHRDPDQTEIGIYFAKQKPQRLLRVLPLLNTSFTIPPNDSAYRVTASFTSPFAVHLYLIAPHMHLLGKTMKVQAEVPGSAARCLIDIRDWDFNWQGTYTFKDPIALPPLTRYTLEATFDNSSSNPRNPNSPPRAVSWGEETTDEMCIAFLGFTLDFETIP